MPPPSNTTGTVVRCPALTPLPEDMALEIALSAHDIRTPQIRKLVRLAAS